MNVAIRARRRLAPAIVFAALMVGWQFAGNAGLISSVYLPAPLVIGASLVKLAGTGELFAGLGATLSRFAIGLLAGAAVGALLGLLMGWSEPIGAFLDPFVAAVYPIPKIALFPLALVVLGIGEAPKLATIALTALFPMLVTSLAGVRQINRLYFEVARNYGARGHRFFTHVLVPGSLPSLFAGLRLSANTAFVMTIALEIISANSGLGVLVWWAWQTFRVSELYAVLLVIALVGLAMGYIVDYLTRTLIPWLGA